jgi:hypothetical protein
MRKTAITAMIENWALWTSPPEPKPKMRGKGQMKKKPEPSEGTPPRTTAKKTKVMPAKIAIKPKVKR